MDKNDVSAPALPPRNAEPAAQARPAGPERTDVAPAAAPVLVPPGLDRPERPQPPHAVQRPQRPRELQDPLNFHLYHPLAWQLAKVLARTPVTPNMVSVAGGSLVVLAGVFYARLWSPLPPWPWSALLGMLLHMGWHVVDGADGDLARLKRISSPLGEMVDGLCDYLSHIVLYLILGWMLSQTLGWMAWALMLAAGLSHIVQSNHVEVQRRFYMWWVYGTPWLNNARQQNPAELRHGLGWLADVYLRLSAGMTPHAQQIDQAVAAAQDDPAALERIRTAVRGEAGPLLRLEKLLGPNPRAIVLGLSMLARSPLYYFLYQAIVLNALLVLSIRRHNAAAQRIAAEISQS